MKAAVDIKPVAFSNEKPGDLEKLKTALQSITDNLDLKMIETFAGLAKTDAGRKKLNLGMKFI